MEPVIDGSPASGLGVPFQKRLLRSLSPPTGEGLSPQCSPVPGARRKRSSRLILLPVLCPSRVFPKQAVGTTASTAVAVSLCEMQVCATLAEQRAESLNGASR